MIDGEECFFDVIEYEILCVEWDDLCVYYVINCVVYSCFNLQIEVWYVDILDMEFDWVVCEYINDLCGVIICCNGMLQVLIIYKWFCEDFGGLNDSVIDYLFDYVELEFKVQIEVKCRIIKYDYDWVLNDVKLVLGL